MNKTQAPAGGTVGMNGEFYTGGQFLPSSETTEKGAKKTAAVKKTGRVQIEFYVWVEGRAGLVPMLYMIGTYLNRDMSVNVQVCNSYGVSIDEAKRAAAAWEAGCRWHNAAPNGVYTYC